MINIHLQRFLVGFGLILVMGLLFFILNKLEQANLADKIKNILGVILAVILGIIFAYVLGTLLLA